MVEPLPVSNQPVPPGVTHENAPIPPGSKDPPIVAAAERYMDVLPLPLAGIFTGRAGRLEMIGGGEDPNADDNEGGSQW